MDATPSNVESRTSPKCGVGAFRLNDHEWWAGESLAACVAQAGRTWGIAGQQLAELVEDAYQIPDADLDALRLVADEQGTKQSFREALRRMRAKQIRLPAFFAGQE